MRLEQITECAIHIMNKTVFLGSYKYKEQGWIYDSCYRICLTTPLLIELAVILDKLNSSQTKEMLIEYKEED